MKNKDKEKRIIAVIGAGGKTSLILHIAKKLKEKGKKVIITTTTHMYEPEKGYYREGQLKEIKKALEAGEPVWVGEPAREHKIKGVSDRFLEKLFLLDAAVLIEADGAKRLPCKVPAEHEPVIPKETQLVIGVAGLDCLGRPLKEICFRAGLAAELLGTDENHLMTEADLKRLLSHSHGTKKGLLPHMEYQVVLNKADLPGAEKAGERIKKELEREGIGCTVLSCNKGGI